MSANNHHSNDTAPPKRLNSVSVPEEDQLTLTWDNIIVKYHPRTAIWDKMANKPPGQPRTLLKGVSGIAKPGELTAIMGSSGAGKTTLLNVFNQRALNDLEVHGNVMLNGTPLTGLDQNQRALIGYVQQHDILPGELTVEEYLSLTAYLSIGNRVSKKKMRQRVDDLLEQLSLKKCADTMIGGRGSISGGEKKRLSVACKLLGKARLIVLDEPTTGLDSYIAKVLITSLKLLTRNGYTIICTIHQPSSDVFSLFDQVYFLAGGRTAYAGPQTAILDYFQPLGFSCPDDFSPADYYIAQLSVVPGAEESSHRRIESICDHCRTSQEMKAIEECISEEYSRHQRLEDHSLTGDDANETRANKSGGKVSWSTQFVLLSWRVLISLKRNPSLAWARLATFLSMSVIMGIIYFNPNRSFNQGAIVDTQGLIFFFCANFTLLSCNRILEVIPRELPLIIREYKDGLYDISAYYMSTILSQSILGMVLLAGSVLPLYIIGGLRLDWISIWFCLAVIVFAYYVNAAYVVMNSVIWETRSAATTIIPQLTVIMSVLGGYFINPRTIPTILLPIRYIDWVAVSYELISANQWRGVDNITCYYSDQQSCITTGEAVLYSYGLQEDYVMEGAYLLCAQFFGYLSIGCVLLYLKMKYKWT